MVDLTFVGGHAIVRAPVPRGAPPAAAKLGTSRTRCPARGFATPRSRFLTLGGIGHWSEMGSGWSLRLPIRVQHGLRQLIVPIGAAITLRNRHK